MPRTPPLISYVNVLADASLTVSAETVDGSGANAVDGLTYDYWVPGAAANIEFQLAAATEVQGFGVAAHTLASNGAGVWLEYWDGAAWVEISRPFVSSQDVTIFQYLSAPVTADLFRVSVSGVCSIGVLWLGPVMVMERSIHQGHAPVTMAEQSSQRANQTETGEWRGVAGTVKGASLSADFRNLSAPWVRATFAPFVTAFNQGKPFFWAWYVDKYPKEVAYCWAGGSDLQVTNSGPRDFMSAGIQASAYLDGPQPLPPIVTTTLYPIYQLDSAAAHGPQQSDTELRTILINTDADETAQASGATVLGAELRALTKTITPDETAQALGASVVTAELRDVVVETAADETAQATGASVITATLETVVIEYADIETAQALGATVTGATLT